MWQMTEVCDKRVFAAKLSASCQAADAKELHLETVERYWDKTALLSKFFSTAVNCHRKNLER